MVQILARRTCRNNACLIGKPGVGKRAIAEGIAQRIASGDVPETIKGKMVNIFPLDHFVMNLRGLARVQKCVYMF